MLRKGFYNSLVFENSTISPRIPASPRNIGSEVCLADIPALLPYPLSSEKIRKVYEKYLSDNFFEKKGELPILVALPIHIDRAWNLVSVPKVQELPLWELGWNRQILWSQGFITKVFFLCHLQNLK